MTRWYLDTSAALKLVVEEAESSALARFIDDAEADLVACWLLETEMRRAAQREPVLTQSVVSDFLDGIDLYEVPASLFREAGLFPGPGSDRSTPCTSRRPSGSGSMSSSPTTLAWLTRRGPSVSP